MLHYDPGRNLKVCANPSDVEVTKFSEVCPTVVQTVQKPLHLALAKDYNNLLFTKSDFSFLVISGSCRY